MSDPEVFEGWYIVEQMGHKKLAGYVREATIAGAGFLRVDVPASEGSPAVTQFLRPDTIYAITPVAEELARRVARRYRPEPVHAFEVKEEPARPALSHVEREDRGPGSGYYDFDPDQDDSAEMDL
jgi:hypothetical protein